MERFNRKGAGEAGKPSITEEDLKKSLEAVKDATATFKGMNEEKKMGLISNKELARHLEIVSKSTFVRSSLSAQCRKTLENYKKERDRYIKERTTEIPQGYAGVVTRKGTNHAFIGTDGLSSCVGFSMYSPSTGRAVLVHFDDELDVTDMNARRRFKEKNEDFDEAVKTSQENYTFYVNELYKRTT